MAKKTSVDLTSYAQDLKDRLSPIYGLRNILSAGLVLLEAVDPAKREELISLIVADDDSNSFNEILDKISGADDAAGGLDGAVAFIRKHSPDGNLDVSIMNAADRRAFDKLRKLVAPDSDAAETG